MAEAQVLVLGGGPDAEREVSLAGAAAVAAALAQDGRWGVHLETIDQLDGASLASLPGDAVFPVLHGPWGEGGPLQDALTADGRPYVGSGPDAARLAMDKMATKLIAAELGVRTPPVCALRSDDPACPLPFPVVVKPAHEGSTIALSVCRDEAAWVAAWESALLEPRRAWMVERFVEGRELTVGALGSESLPVIEIVPADGLYDYDAKYARDDTEYVISPELPGGVEERIRRDAVRLVEALGVRHLARVDFMLDSANEPWLLEVNTMPGFTDHSLLPMAAAARTPTPLDMPALCARLVEMALAEQGVGAKT